MPLRALKEGQPIHAYNLSQTEEVIRQRQEQYRALGIHSARLVKDYTHTV